VWRNRPRVHRHSASSGQACRRRRLGLFVLPQVGPRLGLPPIDQDQSQAVAGRLTELFVLGVKLECLGRIAPTDQEGGLVGKRRRQVIQVFGVAAQLFHLSQQHQFLVVFALATQNQRLVPQGLDQPSGMVQLPGHLLLLPEEGQTGIKTAARHVNDSLGPKAVR
jgi:hypothetical protein